ncbi:unnamed protein product, partial [Effrenium voratum]
GPETLSELGQRFLGGVLAKAPSFCAITNPTVNSYKRLNGAATASGYTWSPNRVSWSGNNRSHMVRVPDKDRFELRLADGAVNPYLLPAVMLACGFWGLDSKADAQKCFFPTSVNMYDPALAFEPRSEILRQWEPHKNSGRFLGQHFRAGFDCDWLGGSSVGVHVCAASRAWNGLLLSGDPGRLAGVAGDSHTAQEPAGCHEKPRRGQAAPRLVGSSPLAEPGDLGTLRRASQVLDEAISFTGRQSD